MCSRAESHWIKCLSLVAPWDAAVAMGEGLGAGMALVNQGI